MVWKRFGEAITIQCRPFQKSEEYLTLKMGLREEFQIIHTENESKKVVIAPPFKERVQINQEFANVDIFIKNLTSNDTGPYWCVYKKFDVVSSQIVETKGNGSVLLVVTGEALQIISFAT